MKTKHARVCGGYVCLSLSLSLCVCVCVCVCVCHDTGMGVSDVDQQKLLDAFYQVNPNGPNGGTGLGLSIASGMSLTFSLTHYNHLTHLPHFLTHPLYSITLASLSFPG